MAGTREEEWVLIAKPADYRGIGKRFGVDPVIAKVITNRGVKGDENIEKYLHGTYESTYDPSLMKDMDKGCRIIQKKIEEGKHIRIVSDYDVDGVTSNYILMEALEKLGATVSYEIPDRIKDGYGINERIINDAYDDGVDTIITCDNGIAAFPAVELAKKLNMTVVVTDHHEVPFEDVQSGGETKRVYKIVPADAVIDHKQPDCEYPFKGLCGAGVAYKFIRNLYRLMNVEWPDDDWLIDILAIATQCDVMDLVDENRIYVREGLRILGNTKNIGLAALMEANGLNQKKILSYHLGFVIGPCINATGRLESAKRGLELLRCTDRSEAQRLAQELTEINQKRKDMTNKGVDEGLAIVRREYMEDKVLVVYMPELHESLAGLVAGKIREAFYKPVLLVTKAESGILKGSGRSIEGYNMFEELTRVKDLMTKFGGHEMAAGFSLEEENLDRFRKQLNENQNLTEKELTPVIRIDCKMPVSYISERLVRQMELLEPFGKGNDKPQFAQQNLTVKRVYKMGKDGRYLRIIFQDETGYTIEGIEFNGDKFANAIKKWFNEEECDKMLNGHETNIRLDVVYYPDINEYNGMTKLQIRPLSYQKGD